MSNLLGSGKQMPKNSLNARKMRIKWKKKAIVRSRCERFASSVFQYDNFSVYIPFWLCIYAKIGLNYFDCILNIDIFDDSMILWLVYCIFWPNSFIMEDFPVFTNKIPVIITWRAVFSTCFPVSIAFGSGTTTMEKYVYFIHILYYIYYIVTQSAKIQHQYYLHKKCI